MLIYKYLKNKIYLSPLANGQWPLAIRPTGNKILLMFIRLDDTYKISEYS